MAKITFFGACNEVGRNAMLLEAKNKKILVDAGIKVGKGNPELPNIPKELAKKIDAIIISHAHIDHCGYLPFLVKQGFEGKIFATPPTRDIMHLLLSDSAKIAKENKADFYGTKEIDKTMKQTVAINYNEEKQLFHDSQIKIKFLNAGHIIGSAEIIIEFDGKKLLYSGDINTRESNLLLPAELPKEKIDFLVMECTYAGKQDILPSMQKASKDLADKIRQVLKRNGKILIPSFAVGRGQEVMFTIDNYIRSGYLPEMDIWLDGMINKANRICRHNVIFMRPEISNRILLADDDAFKSPFFRQPVSKTKKEVFNSKKAVIIATSGMLTGGPSRQYLKKLAGDKKNCVILVGYQAEGSLGRELLEGKKTIELSGKKIFVQCETCRIRFSGHADYNGLLNFAFAIKAQKTFLIHGEKEKLPEFKKTLEKKLKKEILIPKETQAIEL
ncbi:MAG: MBL fold metallo-hydrolase [Candidatus ainarchaeum sp.]|nr:MBL fold metallo-hydrolase [Candidatus ainarchaeum sp.]